MKREVANKDSKADGMKKIQRENKKAYENMSKLIEIKLQEHTQHIDTKLEEHTQRMVVAIVERMKTAQA